MNPNTANPRPVSLTSFAMIAGLHAHCFRRAARHSRFSKSYAYAAVERPPFERCPGVHGPSAIRRSGRPNQRVLTRLANVAEVLDVQENPGAADGPVDESAEEHVAESRGRDTDCRRETGGPCRTPRTRCAPGPISRSRSKVAACRGFRGVSRRPGASGLGSVDQRYMWVRIRSKPSTWRRAISSVPRVCVSPLELTIAMGKSERPVSTTASAPSIRE